MLLHSFYEASVTLMSKPDKTVQKKKVQKFLISANRIQQYIKMILYPDQVGFFPRDIRLVQYSEISQYVSNSLLKKKNHMIISVQKRHFTEFSTHFF